MLLKKYKRPLPPTSYHLLDQLSLLLQNNDQFNTYKAFHELWQRGLITQEVMASRLVDFGVLTTVEICDVHHQLVCDPTLRLSPLATYKQYSWLLQSLMKVFGNGDPTDEEYARLLVAHGRLLELAKRRGRIHV
jgi:hypothetical protein